MNKLLQKEYRLILDYLYHFFHSKTWQEKDTSLDIAIESMVHMGELGEKIGELGGFPDMSLPEAQHFKGFSPQQVMCDIKEEEEAKSLYEKHSGAITSEEIKKLFRWMAKQEDYHAQRLKELFERLNRFTVGSLNKK